jgi:hypothetical protein
MVCPNCNALHVNVQVDYLSRHRGNVLVISCHVCFVDVFRDLFYFQLFIFLRLNFPNKLAKIMVRVMGLFHHHCHLPFTNTKDLSHIS